MKFSEYIKEAKDLTVADIKNFIKIQKKAMMIASKESKNGLKEKDIDMILNDQIPDIDDFLEIANNDSITKNGILKYLEMGKSLL